MGTHIDNKKAGIPTTTGIPAPIQADYRGNFGLASCDTAVFGDSGERAA